MQPPALEHWISHQVGNPGQTRNPGHELRRIQLVDHLPEEWGEKFALGHSSFVLVGVLVLRPCVGRRLRKLPREIQRELRIEKIGQREMWKWLVLPVLHRQAVHIIPAMVRKQTRRGLRYRCCRHQKVAFRTSKNARWKLRAWKKRFQALYRMAERNSLMECGKPARRNSDTRNQVLPPPAAAPRSTSLHKLF